MPTGPESLVFSTRPVPASWLKMLYSEGEAAQNGARSTCPWSAVTALYSVARSSTVPLCSSAAVLASSSSYATKQEVL